MTDPTTQPKDLVEVDAALAAAKARFDHAEARHEPEVLALIRAAEQMRETLDLADGHLVILRMPAAHWNQIVSDIENMCGMSARDIETLRQVELLRA
jgi:hypothetical protein